jgi:hypothetical protein
MGAKSRRRRSAKISFKGTQTSTNFDVDKTIIGIKSFVFHLTLG